MSCLLTLLEHPRFVTQEKSDPPPVVPAAARQGRVVMLVFTQPYSRHREKGLDQANVTERWRTGKEIDSM